MSFKKVLLIVSPVSRPSWVIRYIPQVVGVLEEGGAAVEQAVTRGPGDPARLAGEARGRFDAVVMAGGDGSINEVLNALAGSDTPAGIIPIGTVNVFAREMGIPLHPVRAAEAFLAGRARTFDMGRIGDRGFLLMASFGFDVLVLRRTPRLLKRLLGRYAYVVASLALLPFYRSEPLEVFVDEEEKPHTACFAVFSNAKQYAGKYVVAPEADMNDGVLDVTLIARPGRVAVLQTALGLVSGNLHRKPWVTTVKARRIRLRTGAMELFQVDGDYLTPSSGEIDVQRDAVRVVVPCRDRS